MTPAFYNTPVPASVMNDPYGYAISIAGLLGANVLAIAWAFEQCRRMLDDPHPLKAPITLNRIMMLLLMAGMILRSGPDVVSVMSWPDVLPETRFEIARWNRFLDGAALVPMAAAFMVKTLTMRISEFQLVRPPIPDTLWPTKRKMMRGAWFCMLLTFISCAIAFR